MFEDHRDHLNGRLRDILNEAEEVQGRVKILERQMDIQLRKGLAPSSDAPKKHKTSVVIPQIPNFDKIVEKIENLESFVEGMKSNFKSFEKEAKYDLSSLKVGKAEMTLVDQNIADTALLKENYERLGKLFRAHQGTVLEKLKVVEKTYIPHFQKKIHIHDEAIGLNKACIKNLEMDAGDNKKKLSVLEKKEIDLSSVDLVNLRIEELTSAVKITRTDIATVAKEIREILYTKVDDETLTELEDNIIAKMNELAESIKKNFSKKTETKIGLKNDTLLTMPNEKGKSEEDDAMLSKKPLGGFS